LAVEEMILELTSLTDLSDKEAYMLCSVVGNIKISEIVDEPNYVVSITVPEDIIERRRK
jgi:acetamidase/formamidase